MLRVTTLLQKVEVEIAESSADETDFTDNTSLKVSCCLLLNVLSVWLLLFVRVHCYIYHVWFKPVFIHRWHFGP